MLPPLLGAPAAEELEAASAAGEAAAAAACALIRSFTLRPEMKTSSDGPAAPADRPAGEGAAEVEAGAGGAGASSLAAAGAAASAGSAASFFASSLGLSMLAAASFSSNGVAMVGFSSSVEEEEVEDAAVALTLEGVPSSAGAAAALGDSELPLGLSASFEDQIKKEVSDANGTAKNRYKLQGRLHE